jgi:hypothetical protein
MVHIDLSETLMEFVAGLILSVTHNHHFLVLIEPFCCSYQYYCNEVQLDIQNGRLFFHRRMTQELSIEKMTTLAQKTLS